MKIYIATCLTHVPKNIFEKYVNSIHALAKRLSAFNVKYALINSDPQLKELPYDNRPHSCYVWDRKMVEESDLVIAESSFPSTGLGIELQIAENLSIPVILVFKDYHINHSEPKDYTNPDNKVHELQVGEGFISLMALGLPNISSVIKYENDESLFSQLNPIVLESKKAYNTVYSK